MNMCIIIYHYYVFLRHIFCNRNNNVSKTPSTVNTPPTMAQNLVNKCANGMPVTRTSFKNGDIS